VKADLHLTVEAAERYLALPRPLFTRLPVSYRLVPMALRIRLLRLLHGEEEPAPAPPLRAGIATSYAGRPMAFVLTHDVDTGAELALVPWVRRLAADRGLPSAFGFVPDASWPTEALADHLEIGGAELYWHDIRHDGRLPYLSTDDMRAAFSAVVARSPGIARRMRAFRGGQMLTSAALMDVVAERFAIDLTIPTWERGPYGGPVGCGSAGPFPLRGLTEIPLTMTQDIFARHLPQRPARAVEALWDAELTAVRAAHGVAVLNLHPMWIGRGDRALLAVVERLLDRVADDPEILPTTPTGLLSSMDVPRPEVAAAALATP